MKQIIEIWRGGWNSNMYLNWEEVPSVKKSLLDNAEMKLEEWIQLEYSDIRRYPDLDYSIHQYDEEFTENTVVYEGRIFLLGVPNNVKLNVDSGDFGEWDDAIINHAYKMLDYDIIYRPDPEDRDFDFDWKVYDDPIGRAHFDFAEYSWSMLRIQ